LSAHTHTHTHTHTLENSCPQQSAEVTSSHVCLLESDANLLKIANMEVGATTKTNK